MLIDCDVCAWQHTEHCADCVVTALVDPQPRVRAVVVDDERETAIRNLADAGLIPEIRMRRRTA